MAWKNEHRAIYPVFQRRSHTYIIHSISDMRVRGTETFFVDLRDPEPRSCRVFAFYKPETFRDFLAQDQTIGARLKTMLSLVISSLRDCQFEDIVNLEESFIGAKPAHLSRWLPECEANALVNFAHWLIKFAEG